jgi:hypothetical protein
MDANMGRKLRMANGEWRWGTRVILLAPPIRNSPFAIRHRKKAVAGAKDFDLKLVCAEELPGPHGLFRLCAKNESGCGSGSAFTADYQKDGWGVFYGALKAEPGSEGNASDGLLRQIAKVDGDDAETASL